MGGARVLHAAAEQRRHHGCPPLASSCAAVSAPGAAADSAAGPGERLRIEPLEGCTFGARVTGVSIAGSDLDDRPTMQRIEQAFKDHQLLVFPGQQVGLTPSDQLRFALRFGMVEQQIVFTNQRPDGSLAPLKRMNEFSAKDGSQMDTFGAHSGAATDGWHTDLTFYPISSMYGMLYAEKVPSTGGETEFADMHAAYDALSDEMKETIRGLVSYHSVQYGIARRTGIIFKNPKQAINAVHDDAYLRPLVKIHPVTRRKALFVGMHAFGVHRHKSANGFKTREESMKLLDELVEFGCQAPRTYKHSWQPGDLVIWDQRCCLHRSCPYDNANELRLLHGTRMRGADDTEGALKAPKGEGARMLSQELSWIKKNKVWETYNGSR